MKNHKFYSVLLMILCISFYTKSYAQFSISATNTEILCNGDLSIVTIVANGGTAPYIGLGTPVSTPNPLIISGVIDGPLSGGTPKAVELYAINDIPDLSNYGLGSANNGGGTDGQEFTFPAVSVTAGSYIYIASTGTNNFQQFFGFNEDYTSGALFINGDDAIELFGNGQVIDVFGDINVDGSGQPWEYTDGWAYRNTGAVPNGGNFDINEWTMSGRDALDGATNNATANTPVPVGTFLSGGNAGTQTFGAGTHTVTVSDANGQTASVTFTINEPSALTLNATVVEPLCNGDDATVTISATGGVAPYIGASSGTVESLMITAVIDGPLSGGVPKAVELYVLNDIPDLSVYGLGSANNGGGSDGQEFTFPAVSASEGDFIYVSSNASGVAGFTNFFGFAPDYNTFAMSINGDDAVELFGNGQVIDVFGDINVDGTGQAWEYMDGWAYRNSGALPNGGIFDVNDWSYSGINALDGQSSNSTASSPLPIASFSTNANQGVYTVGAGNYTFSVQDNNGCIQSINVTVNEPAALNVSVNNANVYVGYSPQECADLNTSVTGGTGLVSYDWSDGSTGASNTVCPNTSTTYTIQVADENGCQAAASAYVCVTDVVCFAGRSQNAKVEVCHNGHSICINENAVAAHLAQGYTLGSCDEQNNCPSLVSRQNLSFVKDKSSLVKVYPNPFDKQFSLSVNEDFIGEIFEIIDIAGRVISSGQIMQKSTLISTEMLRSGIYYLNIKNKSTVLKMIKR